MNAFGGKANMIGGLSSIHCCNKRSAYPAQTRKAFNDALSREKGLGGLYPFPASMRPVSISTSPKSIMALNSLAFR